MWDLSISETRVNSPCSNLQRWCKKQSTQQQRSSIDRTQRMTPKRGNLISQRLKTYSTGNQRCPFKRVSLSWSLTSGNASSVTTRKKALPPPCNISPDVNVLAWQLANILEFSIAKRQRAKTVPFFHSFFPVQFPEKIQQQISRSRNSSKNSSV